MTQGQQKALTALCALRGWPAPEFERRVTAERRFRFDAAWPAELVALEVNGGVWTGGRHSGGSGQIRDFEKLNLAQLLGWRVLQVTPQQLTDGTADRWLTLALRRL